MNALLKCPQFDDAEPSLFHRYEAFVIRRLDGNGSDASSQDIGRQLALDLHSEAVRLGTSKAHEFSDDIYWLEQCAAVVSLLAFGRYSSEFKSYESSVQYYRNFPNTLDRVERFEAYVQST
jgi:hypothetical protein